MSASDVIGSERMEALLRGDAPRSGAEERRAALLDGLRAAQLRAPEALRARVLAAAPAPAAARVPWLRRPSRRLALVVVPLAAALAVGAALVHGLVGSGGGKPRAVPVASSPQSHPLYKVPDAGAASSGRAFRAAAAPSVGNTSRLQHTAASLVVDVPSAKLAQATTAATRIATSLGGYAESVLYSTPPRVGGGSASLVLRIPAQNVQAALARLTALGTLVQQQISVKDLQHAFEVQSAQIGELRRSVAALEKALQDPSLPDAQKVLLQIRLAEQKRALAQRLHARTGTVAAGTTAQITLLLTASKHAAAVPHHRGRVGRMVHSAVGFLALEATVALYVLIVAAPFLLLGGLAWGLNRARRRREERRLLAA
jgi:hypothetical protein